MYSFFLENIKTLWQLIGLRDPVSKDAPNELEPADPLILTMISIIFVMVLTYYIRKYLARLDFIELVREQQTEWKNYLQQLLQRLGGSLGFLVDMADDLILRAINALTRTFGS